MKKVTIKRIFSALTVGMLCGARRHTMMLLTTLLFAMTAQTALAAEWPSYITDVVLVGGTSDEVSTAKTKTKYSGYTWCDMDLNKGAGGDDIYLGYKTGNTANTNGGYITDFIVFDAESTNPPSTVTYGGRTYNLCAYDGGSHFKEVKGNLNSNCGKGWNIYLYYTKDKFNKRAATSITINSTKDYAININCYYKRDGILKEEESQIDLNRGISSSSDVYMHFSTTTMVNRPNPEPKKNAFLTYNGSPIRLISSSYTNNNSGTLYYRVGNTGSYTSNVNNVTAIDPGTYTVYYYSDASDYGNSSESYVHSIDVEISKSYNAGLAVVIPEWYGKGTTPQPKLIGKNMSTGSITYKYATSEDGTYTATVPSAPGTYWVKATIAGDAYCMDFTTPAVKFQIVEGKTGHAKMLYAELSGSTMTLKCGDSAPNGAYLYSGTRFKDDSRWSSSFGSTVTTINVDASCQDYEGTTTAYLFCGFISATAINGLKNLNTANVTNMSFMFSFLQTTSLDVSSFNTANVTNMIGMFLYCNQLTKLDLSNFNTANVTYMSDMFSNCSALKTIWVGDGWNTDKVAYSELMFASCDNLVGQNGTAYDSSKDNKEYARIDNSGSHGYLTSGKPVLYVVPRANSYYKDLFFKKYEYDKQNRRYSSNENWWNGIVNPQKIWIDESCKNYDGTSLAYLFYDRENLEEINNLENLGTSNVTDMSYMFYDCRKLTSLDLSGFNTEKVTTMSYMFYNAFRLQTLNVSSFSTAKVTNMSNMFSWLSALQSLDITNFNTANVTTMEGMFNGIANVALNLSNFNTANVTTMEYMFSNTRMTSIDMSSFNTANLTNIGHMFYCSKDLTTVFVSEGWTTEKVPTEKSWSMFSLCKNLVGGNGTKWAEGNVDDKTYACADGVNGQVGYFTLFLKDIEIADHSQMNSNDVIFPNRNHRCNVRLSDRTLYKDGNWNTIFFPFDVDLTDPNGPLYGAIYRTVTAASITGTTLNLTFAQKFHSTDADNTLYAGVPYIIKWKKASDYVNDDAHNIVNPVFNNVTVQYVSYGFEAGEDDGHGAIINATVGFCGTYNAFNNIASAYANAEINGYHKPFDVLLFGDNNTLHYAGNDTDLGACRAFFYIDPAVVGNGQAARLTSFNIDFGDNENMTGIITLNVERETLKDDSWYTLDGRKLQGKPKQKGIYVKNGRKVVVK